MEPVQLAAILAGAALVASMVSVEVGISVALIELALGVLLGNVFNLDPNANWLAFLAGFASVVLTFRGGGGRPERFRGAAVASGRDRGRLVRGPVCGRDADRDRAAGLDHQGVADRRDGAVDNQSRRGVCGACRDGPEHGQSRQS